MFRIFFFAIAVVLVCAKEWVHNTNQIEIRDVVRMKDGTLWAAFAWGLQERQTNKTENTYMPGSNNLKTADFVQLFPLPDDDIVAVSKSGILVRKNKNSQNFEIINNSFAEKKRNLLHGLGKRAENILILPFEGAIAFFDYEQSRSVITLTQTGSSSLEEYEIKRVAVKEDSIWIDLDAFVWKRRIDWKEIHRDNFLADPKSWIEVKDKKIPFDEEAKPVYKANFSSYLSLQRVRAISLHENNVVIWGIEDDADYFIKIRDNEWGSRFLANTSGFLDGQKDATSRSLALLPDGSFAMGRWGSGLLVFNNGFPESQFIHWFHSRSPENTNNCPSEWSNTAWEGWTIIQGLVAAPDYSGYIFSYVSETKYGLGFVNNSGNSICVKPAEASSPVAFAIITRQRETGDWEIYAAWKYSMDSKGGGIDFYLSPQNKFSPALQQKWTLPFDSPTDFAFDSRGVLWAVSESKIFYLSQKDDEWKEPSYIRGFGGGIISTLKTDAQNGLWISTLGDGAYSFSQINNSPDSLVAKQYKIKDGLLNETVYDIAIDTIKGKVYFAHDLGLSVYSTALVRSASSYMQSGSPKPISYPNPFRPGVHNYVTIDFISEKSSVYILDSSGKRVRLFRGKDLRGGAVIWDGKNESGKFVAPGLYYYIAADGKNTAKGKIIIER